MYTLECSFAFEAGHQLKQHRGKCQNAHGHSYSMTLHFQSKTLQKKGSQKNMIIDGEEVKKKVRSFIETHLDHKWLNDTLKTDSPTVEFIAKWIFDRLKPLFNQLTAVTVQETTSIRATYESI